MKLPILVCAEKLEN